jgi:hypothetical protein
MMTYVFFDILYKEEKRQHAAFGIEKWHILLQKSMRPWHPHIVYVFQM